MSAAMAPRRRKPARLPAVALDHGPAIRMARGDTTLADRADPDAPNRTVRGARVVPAYEALCHTRTQTAVCLHLAETHEKAEGADWQPDGVAVHRAPWERSHYAERQLAARQRLRRAQNALDGQLWDMLELVVIKGHTVSSLISGGAGREILARRFRSAVDRLGEHWRMV